MRNAAIVHTYTVTTTADTTPAACPATTTEPCTLRQAVIQANTDGTLDKIKVPASTSPYLLETDQLSVTDPGGVVFAGSGQAKSVVQADTTSSSYPFRVLQISNGSAVQISNMTIQDGHSSTSTEDGNGGGIEVLSGSLTMGNSTVTGNTADNYGGGIYVAGLNSIGGASGAQSQAYLRNVTISDNSAASGGGGLDIEGQALMQGTVTHNTLSGTSSDGGGIRLGDDGVFIPTLSASNFSVTANTATADGGGIYNVGSVALTTGAIGGPAKADGNAAQDPGGGLYNGQVATLDAVAVQHNNVATSGEAGGGIENTDRLSMTGGSLSGNRAPNAAGLDNETAQATLNDVKVSRNVAMFQAGGIGSISDSSLSISGGSIARNSALSGAGGGVYTGAAATINGTSITHNTAQGPEGFGDGGGVFNQGRGSSLSVSGGSIADNNALDQGGGVWSDEPASINGTSIIGNAASADGGGVDSSAPLTLTGVQLGSLAAPNVAQEGGGLFTEVTGATIVRSTIEGNQARNAGAGTGGGIFNSDGADTELRATTVSGNSSDGAGGGITNFGGVMSVLRSTISANTVISGAASASGGGISNMPDTSRGIHATLNLVNDTVTGNHAGAGATPGFGGGLDNTALASATLTNVTLTQNRAHAGGAGGGVYNNGVAALRGTILAGNTLAGAPANCGLPVAIISNGYNLSSDTTCGLTGIGDQTAVDPMLGPLASNGGPTETQALKPGSPAIDAVKYCPPPKTDQRGVNRQSPCDVGAYERVPNK